MKSARQLREERNSYEKVAMKGENLRRDFSLHPRACSAWLIALLFPCIHHASGSAYYRAVDRGVGHRYVWREEKENAYLECNPRRGGSIPIGQGYPSYPTTD